MKRCLEERNRSDQQLRLPLTCVASNRRSRLSWLTKCNDSCSKLLTLFSAVIKKSHSLLFLCYFFKKKFKFIKIKYTY